VARGLGTWNGDESSLPSIPAKRDGYVVPANGYFVIRFKADNPGVWFYHCHIDLHLVGGMAATIVEAPEALQISISAAGASLCSAGDYKSSGNCNGDAGSISAADATSKCNTIYNFKGNDRGALIS
jgi:iron transport multicopper oxidase